MPSCLLQGCSNDLIIFRADGGNHFTHYGIYEGMFLMLRVPLWKKMNLTVEEAAEYSGIGVSKIKEISNQKNCPFVLWNGTKRLIKRKQFEDYLETQYSV